MVAIALLCAIIYYTVLLAQAVMVVITLCRKQENIEALSESAKKRYSVSETSGIKYYACVRACMCNVPP